MHAAACTCEAMLLPPGETGGIDILDATRVNDPELIDYVNERDAAGGSLAYCAGVPGRRRAFDEISMSAAMACRDAPNPDELYERPPGEPHPGGPGGYEPGTCRAAFNACLGRELERASSSVINPMPDASSKLWTLRAARERLLASAFENVGIVGVNSDNCNGVWTPYVVPWTSPSDPPMRSRNECFRFIGGPFWSTEPPPEGSPLGLQLPIQIADAVHRVSMIAHEEVRLRRALADTAFSSTVAGSSGFIVDQWGRDSHRMGAARTIFGGGDLMFVASRTDSSGAYLPSYFAPDWELPVEGSASPETDRIITLLASSRAPVGAIRVGGVVRPFDLSLSLGPSIQDGASAIYNFLDHRLAALARTPPYDAPSAVGDELRGEAAVTYATFASLAGAPLPDAQSRLKRQHEITLPQLRRALRIAADRLALFHTSFDAVDSVQASGGALTGDLLAATNVAQLDRETLILQNALGRLYPVGGTDRALYADIKNTGMGWPTTTGAPLTDDYYDLGIRDPATTIGSTNGLRFGRMGTAGALHVLRVHMARILSIEETNPASDVRAAIERNFATATQIIDQQIGEYFTEWDRYGSRQSACANAGFSPTTAMYQYSGCDHVHELMSGLGHWELYYRLSAGGSDPFSEGTYYFTSSIETARCWVDGGPVGGGSTSCPAMTPLTIVDVTPSVIGFGDLLRRRFSLANPASYPVPSATGDTNSEVYVVRVVTGGESPYVALIDVFDPKERFAVHTHGGELQRALEEALERNPRFPSRSSTSALGVHWDLVPPLDNGVIEGPNGDIEDSYAEYVNRFTAASDNAVALMQSVRNDELQAVMNARNDVANLALVRSDYLSELGRLCGASASDMNPCVASRADVKPAGLGLVPESAPLWEASCEETIRTFHSDMPELGSDFDEVALHLQEGLACMFAQIRKFDADTTLRDLPEDVVREFNGGGVGDFVHHHGEMRALNMAVFGALVDARRSARDFADSYTVASESIRDARDSADELEDDERRHRITCIIGLTSAQINQAIQVAGSTINTRERVSRARSETGGFSSENVGMRNAFGVEYARSFDASMESYRNLMVKTTDVALEGCGVSDEAMNRLDLSAVIRASSAMQVFSQHYQTLIALAGHLATSGEYYRLS